MSLCTLLQRWDTKWIHCSETGHHSVSLISLTPPWTNPIICYQSSLGFLQTLLLDIDTGAQAHWGRSTEMGWIPGQWHQLLSNEDTRSLLTVVTWDATQSSKSNQRKIRKIAVIYVPILCPELWELQDCTCILKTAPKCPTNASKFSSKVSKCILCKVTQNFYLMKCIHCLDTWCVDSLWWYDSPLLAL